MRPVTSSRSAFFRPRILLSFFFLLTGAILAVVAFTVSSSTPALAQRPLAVRMKKTSLPDAVRMEAYSEDRDLRALPQIPPNEERDELPLRRHLLTAGSLVQDSVSVARRVALATSMPGPSLVFDGVTAAESGCRC